MNSRTLSELCAVNPAVMRPSMIRNSQIWRARSRGSDSRLPNSVQLHLTMRWAPDRERTGEMAVTDVKMISQRVIMTYERNDLKRMIGITRCLTTRSRCWPTPLSAAHPLALPKCLSTIYPQRTALLPCYVSVTTTGLSLSSGPEIPRWEA